MLIFKSFHKVCLFDLTSLGKEIRQKVFKDFLGRNFSFSNHLKQSWHFMDLVHVRIGVDKFIINSHWDESRLDLLSGAFRALHLQKGLQIFVNLVFLIFGLLLRLTFLMRMWWKFLLRNRRKVKLRLRLLDFLLRCKLLSLLSLETLIEYIWLLLVHQILQSISLIFLRGVLMLELLDIHLMLLRKQLLKRSRSWMSEIVRLLHVQWHESLVVLGLLLWRLPKENLL